MADTLEIVPSLACDFVDPPDLGGVDFSDSENDTPPTPTKNNIKKTNEKKKSALPPREHPNRGALKKLEAEFEKITKSHANGIGKKTLAKGGKSIRRGKNVPITKTIIKKGTNGGIKRPHRFKPGTVAIRDIKKQQSISFKKRAIARLPLQRLVREIAQDYKEDVRFTGRAFDALHEAVESFAIRMFEGSGNYTCISKLMTLYPEAVHAFLLSDREGWERVGWKIPQRIQQSFGLRPNVGPGSRHSGFSNNFG